MSQNKSTKSASRSLKAAGTTAAGNVTFADSNPILEQLRAVIGGLLNDPLTLGPDDVERNISAGVGGAQQAASQFLDQSRAKRSTTSGVRSGASRGDEFVAAAGLGSEVARINDEARTRAALQRNQDFTTLTNLALASVAPQLEARQNQVNAQLGQAGGYTNLAQVPSPASQLFGGLGELLGITLTAGGRAGGISNIFQ